MKYVFLMVVCVLGATLCAASTPAFDYQAILTKADGNPFSAGEKATLAFRLLDPRDTIVWTSDTQEVTAGEGGAVRLSVRELEDWPTAYADWMMTDEDLTLEVFVYFGSGENIRVRQRMLPVPTAVYARVAEGAPGDFRMPAGWELRAETGTTAVKSVACSTLEVLGKTTIKGKLEVAQLHMSTPSSTFAGQLPVGSIIPWSGTVASALPNGWAICDGTNGTIDLRDRFLRGAVKGGSDAEKVGGEAMHTLTSSEMPRHAHTFKYAVPGSYNGKPKGYTDKGTDNWPKHRYWYGSETTWGHTSSKAGGGNVETGAANPHENRPSYYALYYIQRIK